MLVVVVRTSDCVYVTMPPHVTHFGCIAIKLLPESLLLLLLLPLELKDFTDEICALIDEDAVVTAFMEAIDVVSVVVDTVISAGIVNDEVADDDVLAMSHCTLAFFDALRLLVFFDFDFEWGGGCCISFKFILFGGRLNSYVGRAGEFHENNGSNSDGTSLLFIGLFDNELVLESSDGVVSDKRSHSTGRKCFHRFCLISFSKSFRPSV